MNVAELTPAQPVSPVVRRRRWVSIILALVIFGSGFVVGGAAALLVVRNRVRYAIQHPEQAPAAVAHVLRRKLSLDDEQTRKIESILRARHEAFRRQVYPRATAELERAEREVAEVLDSAQRERWQELLRQWRGNWLPPPPEEKQERS